MKRTFFVLFLFFFFFSCKRKARRADSKPAKNEDGRSVLETENSQNEPSNEEAETFAESDETDFAEGGRFALGDETKKNELAEKIYQNEKKSLRLFSNGDESFFLSEDGKTSVRFSGNDLIRKFFDEKFRLRKKEIWFIADVSDKSKKVSSEIFSYTADEVFPASSVVTGNDFEMERTFVQDGKLASESFFRVSKKNGRELCRKKNRTYNDSGLLSEEKTSAFQTKYGKTKEVSNEKKTYEYDDKNKIKTYSEYHDGILRVRKQYSSEENYELAIFFDDGYEIITLYGNGKKIGERVLLSGVEIRKRSYEK